MKRFLIIILIGTFVFTLRANAEAFTTDLYYGLQSNAEVSQLQTFLTSGGFYSGQISGNFFSLTRSALKAFQVKEGIAPATGFFGPLTRARVNMKLGNAPIKTPTFGMNAAPADSASTTIALMQNQINALLKRIAYLEASQLTPFPTPPTIDSVKTLPLVQLSPTSVIMNGWISSYPALVTFDIGGSEGFDRNVGKGYVYFESNNVSTTITGLWPGATYYYRISAIAPRGVDLTVGQTLVFTPTTSTTGTP